MLTQNFEQSPMMPARVVSRKFRIVTCILYGHLIFWLFSKIAYALSPPVINSQPIISGYSGELFEYSVQATDADGDNLTYSRVDGPKQMKVVGNTFRWSIGKNKTGDFPVTVGVSDGTTTVEQSYVITVTQFVNSSPAITSVPVTSTNAGELYQYDVEATDPDGDPISYAL